MLKILCNHFVSETSISSQFIEGGLLKIQAFDEQPHTQAEEDARDASHTEPD